MVYIGNIINVKIDLFLVVKWIDIKVFLVIEVL